MKVLEATPGGLSNIAILAIVGMVVAFFLMGGMFPAEKSTKPIPPPPPTVQLSSPSPHTSTASQAQESKTVQVSSQQPVARSDEEGTRLNLQAYEFMQQGDYQKAEPVLRQAVQTFPQGTTAVGYKYALYNLGHVLRKTGRARESIPYFQKCAQIDPEWSKVQTELAIAKEQAQASTVL